MNSERNGRLMSLWLAIAVVVGVVAAFIPLLASAQPFMVVAIFAGLIICVFLVLGWPMSGVAVLIVSALLTRYRFEIGPVSVRLEHIAVLLVGALAFFQMLVYRGRLYWPLSAWFATAWVAINLIAGAFFSPDPIMGLQNGLRISLLLLTFILLVNLIPNLKAWRWAIAIFLVAGVVEAAFGITARVLYVFGINLGVQVAWNFTEPIPYGTFEEGNLFGSHVASWAIVLLMVVLAVGIVRHPRKRYIVWILGLLILLVALFLSLSRAAWLMFGVGAMLAWVFYLRGSWHQTNRLLLILTVTPFVLLSLLAIAPLLPDSLPVVNRLQSFLTLSTDATFSARLSDWSMAWEDWLQKPLTGWGPGSFAMIHGELRARPAWISNLSLRLLQETGVVGILAFFGFVITLILPAIKAIRKGADSLDRALMLGLVIAYIVLIFIAYQSTDGIWLAASWVHAGLIAAGTRLLFTSA